MLNISVFPMKNQCILGFQIRGQPLSAKAADRIISARAVKNLSLGNPNWPVINPRLIIGRNDTERAMPDYLVPDFLTDRHLIKPEFINKSISRKIINTGYSVIMLTSSEDDIVEASKSLPSGISRLACCRPLKKSDVRGFYLIGSDIVSIMSEGVSVLTSLGPDKNDKEFENWERKYICSINEYGLFKDFVVAQTASREIKAILSMRVKGTKSAEYRFIAVEIYARTSVQDSKFLGCAPAL